MLLQMGQKVPDTAENGCARALGTAEDTGEGRVRGFGQRILQLDVALEEEFPAVEDTVGGADAGIDALPALGVFGHVAFEAAFFAFPERGRRVHGAGTAGLYDGFLLFADLEAPCS